MDIIYCAGGGRVLAEIALQEGFLYGSRSDDIRPKPRCNGLIDINWKNYNWSNHLEAVKAHRPKYAVVPDITRTQDIYRILSLANSIEKYCRRVVIVPKIDSIIQFLPDNYVIGISVPTSYSGYLISVSELIGRDVHLLGGSPGQQRELWKYYRSMSIEVISADCNSHNKVSNYGNYWNGYKWIYEGKHVIDKYEAFRRSCQGIIKMWKALGAL